jgi:hypothetical protein
VSGRGRHAALPPAGLRTPWGLVDGPGGSVVRCFSQDGQAHRDYDFSGLRMAEPLRAAVVAAFAARTAPGAGLASLSSAEKAYRAVTRFDRYLAGLAWPPEEPAQVTKGHYDGFCASGKQLRSADRELAVLRSVLVKVEGISDALAGRLAGPLPKRQPSAPKMSYSRAEFKRIAEAARADLRAAARRIRGNRDLLGRFRAGELHPGGDAMLAQRLELLAWVDHFGDVPRTVRSKGPSDRCAAWVHRHGSVREIVSWLHLTHAETAAGAVLLAVMTGHNPEAIINTPAAHHRADGYREDGQGTAIVDLRKLRRGHRAYMSLALAEVPDWISIPGKPEGISARDELHTPFGLYALLHELTAGSRALLGGNRLLIGYSQNCGTGVGHGLRPFETDGHLIARLGRSYALIADAPDADGNPVPLPLQLSRLRLTYIELHQKPVAHTEVTAATHYLARNRGNITEYRKVVAATLTSEAGKARTRGTLTTMPARDVERARNDPQSVAAEYGLDPVILKRMLAGELDTVMASCIDNTGGPHAPAGQSCTASFILCLSCECARALPQHLPAQVLVHDALSQRREQINALQWAQRFALPHAQLTDLLSQHDQAALADARRDATDADRAMIDRFLRQELDLR